jgi:hypothetical protein
LETRSIILQRLRAGEKGEIRGMEYPRALEVEGKKRWK